VLDDGDVRVEGVDRDPRGLDLALPDAIGRVDDLALEVADIDDIEVDEPDRADSAAARYSAAGLPSPPAPISRAFDSSSFFCPADPTSGISRWRL
jgi:hypothetical protein